VRLRREATHPDPLSTVKGNGTGRTFSEDWAWRVWAAVTKRPALYRLTSWFATRFGKALPAGAPLLRDWTQTRTKPVPARRSLSERARSEGVPHV
jgi:L-lactate dehydrogenase complex protein LldF